MAIKLKSIRIKRDWFRGLRFKLFSVLAVSACITLVVGFLGVFSIQLLLNKTGLIIEEEVPRLTVLYKAVTSLIKVDEAVEGAHGVQNFSEIDTVQKYESQYRTNAFELEMYLEALSLGSNSPEFANEAGGLFQNEWKELGLENVIVKKPTNSLAVLAVNTVDKFKQFSVEAQLSISAHRRYLRLENDGLTDEAERVDQDAHLHLDRSDALFTEANSLLNRLVENPDLIINEATRAVGDLQRQQFLLITLITIAGFLISILISTIFASRVIVRPVERVMEVVRQVTAGDLSKRIRVSSKDEIGQLASSFNDMTRTLDDLYQNLEQKVSERTKEVEDINKDLQKNIKELEKFQRLTVGRELKMVELKKEVKTLEERIAGLKETQRS